MKNQTKNLLKYGLYGLISISSIVECMDRLPKLVQDNIIDTFNKGTLFCDLPGQSVRPLLASSKSYLAYYTEDMKNSLFIYSKNPKKLKEESVLQEELEIPFIDEGYTVAQIALHDESLVLFLHKQIQGNAEQVGENQQIEEIGDKLCIFKRTGKIFAIDQILNLKDEFSTYSAIKMDIHVLNADSFALSMLHAETNEPITVLYTNVKTTVSNKVNNRFIQKEVKKYKPIKKDNRFIIGTTNQYYILLAHNRYIEKLYQNGKTEIICMLENELKSNVFQASNHKNMYNISNNILIYSISDNIIKEINLHNRQTQEYLISEKKFGQLSKVLVCDNNKIIYQTGKGIFVLNEKDISTSSCIYDNSNRYDIHVIDTNGNNTNILCLLSDDQNCHQIRQFDRVPSLSRLAIKAREDHEKNLIDGKDNNLILEIFERYTKDNKATCKDFKILTDYYDNLYNQLITDKNKKECKESSQYYRKAYEYCLINLPEDEAVKNALQEVNRPDLSNRSNLSYEQLNELAKHYEMLIDYYNKLRPTLTVVTCPDYSEQLNSLYKHIFLSLPLPAGNLQDYEDLLIKYEKIQEKLKEENIKRCTYLIDNCKRMIDFQLMNPDDATIALYKINPSTEEYQQLIDYYQRILPLLKFEENKEECIQKIKTYSGRHDFAIIYTPTDQLVQQALENNNTTVQDYQILMDYYEQIQKLIKTDKSKDICKQKIDKYKNDIKFYPERHHDENLILNLSNNTQIHAILCKFDKDEKDCLLLIDSYQTIKNLCKTDEGLKYCEKEIKQYQEKLEEIKSYENQPNTHSTLHNTSIPASPDNMIEPEKLESSTKKIEKNNPVSKGDAAGLDEDFYTDNGKTNSSILLTNIKKSVLTKEHAKVTIRNLPLDEDEKDFDADNQPNDNSNQNKSYANQFTKLFTGVKNWVSWLISNGGPK